MGRSAAAMTVSLWQRTTRESALDFDVVVVGGGIIGVSTAYWLKREDPKLKVAVVEANRLASGASGRNAGFLIQGTASDYVSDIAEHGWDKARRLWHFSQENRDLMLQELAPRGFEFEASGSLTVAGSAEEDERLRACVSRMRADGFPVAYIPNDETNRRLTARGFYGSLYVASGGMLNPVLLVRQIAEKSGADVLEHHRVLEMRENSGRVTLETPQRAITCSAVVLALNAYLPQLVPDLGRYVRPIRAQMLATKPVAPRWLQVPAYSHEGYYYIRQRPDGGILLGGARHLHALEERGYTDETTPALQTDLERFMHHHFPQTRGIEIAQRWSGVMGFSPDGLPVVGEVPRLPNSHFATGFTGHGMGYGFQFGRLMADIHRRGLGATEADLFDCSRFADERRSSLRVASQ